MQRQKTAVISAIEKLHLTVPDQDPRPLKNAVATANSLGGRLAKFKKLIMAVNELAKALKDKYAIAVDPEGLLEKIREAGWYQIIRDNNTNEYRAIQNTQAVWKLRAEGRYSEVVYVGESAITAAKQKLPIAVAIGQGVRDGIYLVALGWPDDFVRVALEIPTGTGIQKTITTVKLRTAKTLPITKTA